MRVGSVVGLDGNMYPTLSLTVAGPGGNRRTIEATLDTGFTGAISLPIELIERLELDYVRDRVVTLADGSQRDTAIFRGSVMLAGEWRDTEVHCSGHIALAGMRLMYGAKVSFDAVPGGGICFASLNLPQPRWPLSRR